MKSLVLSILLLIVFNATAQIKELVNDPKVGWIAQGTTDFRLDLLPNRFESSHLYKNDFNSDLEIIKLHEFNFGYTSDGYNHFVKILFHSISQSTLKTYSDSLCTKEIEGLSLISKIDTIEVFDPTTLEKKWKVTISLNPKPYEITIFRAFQTFYYEPELGIWKTKTHSIAPLINDKFTLNDSISIKPLFWIKVEQQEIKNENEIDWKVRTISNEEQNYLDVESFKILKKNSKDLPMVDFLNKCKKNKKINLYKSDFETWNSKILLSQIDKEIIFEFNFMDTIQIIDPVTFEVEQKNFETKISAIDIKKLKLIQEWSWDDKLKKIYSKLISVAPSRSSPLNNGIRNFYYPLFYFIPE